MNPKLAHALVRHAIVRQHVQPTPGAFIRFVLLGYNAAILGVIILLAVGVDLGDGFLTPYLVWIGFALLLLFLKPIRFVIRAIRRRSESSGDQGGRHAAQLATADTPRPLVMRAIAASYRAVLYGKVGTGSLMVIALVLAFVAYALGAQMKVRELNTFCADVKPGLSVSEAPSIAEKYGVRLHVWPNMSKTIKKSPLLVEAPGTFGDQTCSVYHDHGVVTRVEPSKG